MPLHAASFHSLLEMFKAQSREAPGVPHSAQPLLCGRHCADWKLLLLRHLKCLLHVLFSVSLFKNDHTL